MTYLQWIREFGSFGLLAWLVVRHLPAYIRSQERLAAVLETLRLTVGEAKVSTESAVKEVHDLARDVRAVTRATKDCPASERAMPATAMPATAMPAAIRPSLASQPGAE